MRTLFKELDLKTAADGVHGRQRQTYSVGEHDNAQVDGFSKSP